MSRAVHRLPMYAFSLRALPAGMFVRVKDDKCGAVGRLCHQSGEIGKQVSLQNSRWLLTTRCGVVVNEINGRSMESSL
jgi:hypothetical protein